MPHEYGIIALPIDDKLTVIKDFEHSSQHFRNLIFLQSVLRQG